MSRRSAGRRAPHPSPAGVAAPHRGAASRSDAAIPPAALALCVDGARHQDAGRIDEAIRCYRRAVERAPCVLDLRLVLVTALGLAGRTAEGTATLRAFGGAPGFEDAVRMGEAFRRLPSWDDAADCYRRARWPSGRARPRSSPTSAGRCTGPTG